MKKIVISDQYTKTPGGRSKQDGAFSGEDFREKLLEENFIEAIQKKEKLLIDFDGGYGYPISFLEEAFGGLARKYGADQVLKTLVFISNDEPGLIKEVEGYIKDTKK